MDYRVTFYSTINGDRPMAEFMNHLRRKHPDIHALMSAGLKKLRNSDHHGGTLTSPVQGYPGLFELRVGDTNIARAFFFFRVGQEIIVTNGYVKKKQKINRAEVGKACRFKEDWEARNT